MLFRATSLLTVLHWALSCVPEASAAFPDTPFTTDGRDIVSASGEKVVFAGVNWPGQGMTMLPEGLQYNSIANITSIIKQDLGMNVIRLTYAIEMVDDYLGDSPNQSLKATLANALGEDDRATVLEQILDNNPQFTEETTRLEVFDAVAEEAARQEVWVLLDNHVSKAIWCCSHTDGNAWFGDDYFNVYNWHRGLGFMADHTKSWKALAAMSLRNELREATDSTTAEPYTWDTWLKNVIPAATGIHSNNSLPLIFFSGLNYDTDDSFMIDGTTTDDGASFEPSSYPFSDRIVYEIHNYDNGATSCDDVRGYLYDNAYGAMNLSDPAHPNKGPVVMTEFGFNQEDGSSESVYAQCIQDVVLDAPGGPAGWMQWVISGSYYIRERTKDFEETWGILNHAWDGWRNETVVENYDLPFVDATFSE
ncbi:hypothetical protein D0869_09370 [Hortaea werneckii]|uniref:Glycoside hydrolase family 5 domain-containing protein n=1 Tax=Hortaea werneckii TaxID=91943 RepID=A0A3M6WHT9_HORWE|nr:glycoside hydrolase family 5 protein [Hortaea werneckii]KAI7593660.1 glycoside hydrolase family 5 protein [Hortaea werneckii]RMX78084.1 hypothetical protein D0869_09370 [Hortaea werneckii]RMY00059.1 hypothetical protein D0868_09216 [Hortaea werneckii]